MNKNIEYIMELCKFKSPDKDKLSSLMESGLDYPYILGHLLYSRMGGIAYYTLKKCGLHDKLNREFRNTLKIIFDSNFKKTEGFLICLNELSIMLRSVELPYAVLKGGYLTNIYPAGLRTSNDLDILIEGKNITRLSNILKDHGFIQGSIKNNEIMPASRTEILSSRMNRGETVPFVKQIDLPELKFLEIDINFTLDFKAKQESNAVNMFLANIDDRIKTKNGSLYTLSEVDFLIHLCVHLFKEATVINWVEMGRDLSLYKFSDIYLLLSELSDQVLKTQLEKRIWQLELRKECYYTFLYTKQLYNIDNPLIDELIDVIQPENLEYLNQIIDPQNKKVYHYNADFSEWIFYSNRKELLYEVEYDTKQS